MAKYNAAKHTIESDDGRTTLATLHFSVRADKGFEIADWWGGDSEAMEVLNEELSILQSDKWNAEGRLDHAASQLHKAEDKLSDAKARIEELEAEIGSITGFIQGSDRIDEDTRAAIEALVKEIARARAKFPNNRHMLAALTEEVGELAKALVEEDEEWRTEAIQCACVAIRVATEGDGDFEFSEKGAAAA